MSKVTAPQDTQGVRAAGLPWLKHFTVQYHIHVGKMLLGFRKKQSSRHLATRPEVEGFRDQDLFTRSRNPLQFRIL